MNLTPSVIQRYLEFYAGLESGRQGMATVAEKLSADFPDDPVIALHARRLAQGQEGVRLVMDEK